MHLLPANISTAMSETCTSSKMPKTRLADDFQPNNYTVLCGRGKEFFNYVGNRRFRILVDMHLERYSLAETKTDKTRIVIEIVEQIRHAGGGFCKQDKVGDWYDVGDAVAREKVGALFRDCLFNMYKSSSKAKTAVRRQRRRCNARNANKPSRCRGTSNGSSGGSITDSTITDSSYHSNSSSSSEVYDYEDCKNNNNGQCHDSLHVKEVQFNFLEHDLQPLMYDVEFDMDEDVAAFNFVEI
ncbi:hypothetical protein MPSEU_000037100 [Mayamaea pseudoterrestris]|nr:hypothetical protein MPSEU_000037100 [Mayamaea pseudoterrestris]